MAPTLFQPFNKTIIIEAHTSAVWQALTTPALMQQWMSETPIEVHTNWKVGDIFTISDPWYKSKFGNYGKVLQYEPQQVLSYSHLSSLSRLPFTDENACIFSFELTPLKGHTSLSFTASNFPTEAIYRHIVFYWNVTLELLKKFVQQHL